MSISQNEVTITKDIAQTLRDFLNQRNYSKICLITDNNTSLHCYPLIRDVIKGKGIQIQIPAGEEFKNLNTCNHIWRMMTEAALDRKSLVINLGGGVIGDMGGFCASTYKRGIDFIQIPTTLLSQVDASVGGKLGIDFTDAQGQVFKNHIGVFNIPQSVMIDIAFLKTLDPREIKSGFAEIIKHCLIADKNKWEELIKLNYEDIDWENFVQHSVDIKDEITTSDPQEKGLRKILNFGHTLGHAVESFYLNTPNKLLHGEAIAVGMIMESYLSYKKAFITSAEHELIKDYILSIYGKFDKLNKKYSKQIIQITKQDKKNENDAVLFSLLEEIGQANFNIALSDAEMEEAIEYYISI